MKEGTKNILRQVGLGSKVDEVEKGNCPLCHKSINPNEFRDEISKREFGISGMCQKCQDLAFK